MGAFLSRSTGNEKLNRPAEDVESTEEITTTKITDLNDDCLMKIFEYLDIESLFNVALANTWLRPATVAVYASRFGGRKIIYLNHSDDDYHAEKINTQNLWNIDTTIHVYGSKTCLQYLRCFGSMIKNLRVNFMFFNSERYEYMHQYINTYCVDNLEEIEFMWIPSISIDHFVKPFYAVRSVMVMHCDLDEILPQFVESFPNLRHLKLENVNLSDGFDQAHFQHLEHLYIKGITTYDKNYIPKFNLQNAANLLHSNRQLQNLEINFDCETSMNTALDMIKDHVLINKLSMRFPWSNFLVINSLDVKRIVSEHLSLIELNLGGCTFIADDAIVLIDQLKLLETFEFRFENTRDITRIESYADKNDWILTTFNWNSYYVKLNRKH